MVLKEAGPYTAPLCFAMMFAMRWLTGERKELITALRESQQREREIGEKRTAELLQSATAMGESARVIEKALNEHDRLLEKAIERWDSSK